MRANIIGIANRKNRKVEVWHCEQTARPNYYVKRFFGESSPVWRPHKARFLGDVFTRDRAIALNDAPVSDRLETTPYRVSAGSLAIAVLFSRKCPRSTRQPTLQTASLLGLMAALHRGPGNALRVADFITAFIGSGNRDLGLCGVSLGQVH